MKKKRKGFLAFLLSAFMVVAMIPGMAFADATSLPDADASGVIKLTENVTISSGFPTSGTIDLNGYTLTYTGTESIDVTDGNTLIIKDGSVSGTDQGGTLVLESGITGTSAYICPEANSTVSVSNIKITSTGSVFYPYGDTAAVNITNCTVYTTGVYCVATNSKTLDNYGVEINIENSTLTAAASDGDDCAVMLNVAGSLNISNSTITGDRQAVVVRAGNATITDSEIVVTGTGPDYGRTSGTWGSGNEVAQGALVVGDYQTTEKTGTSVNYNADAIVNVTNTAITSQSSSVAAVYADTNPTNDTVINLGEGNEVTGTVTTGQYNKLSTAVANTLATLSITGGTYNTDDVGIYLKNSDGSAGGDTYVLLYNSVTGTWEAMTATEAEEQAGAVVTYEVDGVNYTVYYASAADVPSIEATVTGYSGDYDGKAHTITVAVTNPSDAVVTYSTDGTNYSDTLPTYTDAGTYTIYYMITSSGIETVYGSETVSIAQAAQSISYDTTSVSKTVGGDAFKNELTQTTVYGTITYTSSDEEVATVDENGKVTIVGVGTATITATVSGNDNYSEATASYTVSVEEGTSYDSQIVTEELAEKHITDGLSNVGFDTVEKIKNELMGVLITNTDYSEENSVTYDVSLQISVDGGAWQNATEMNYPTSGLTVTLPYPDGTNKDDYDFRVVHMFTTTSSRLGTTAGDTETPTVTKTDDGIQVTLKGLSPVTVGWTEINTSSTSGTANSSGSSGSNSTNTTATTADSSAQTGDDANIALWIVLMLAAAAAGTCVVGSRRFFGNLK